MFDNAEKNLQILHYAGLEKILRKRDSFTELFFYQYPSQKSGIVCQYQ
jgi:hypothetical protein